MSLFLGPIHHWMWKKIQFQNQLNNHLFASYPLVVAGVEEKVGGLSDQPLEDQIQTDNIHGWLQEKVSVVEAAYAYGVELLLQQEGVSFEGVKEQVGAFGKSQKLTSAHTPLEVFEELSNLLLDGMPCDRVNEVTEETQNYLDYKQNSCVHSPFWSKTNVDAVVYYQLREALLAGLLESSDFQFHTIKEYNYRVERRA